MSNLTDASTKKTLYSVITASSVGTLIEWYDFYIFGSLAAVISTQFFPKDNPTAAFLSTLAIFATGFIVRPFGALFFGRLGDLIGRKYTFLLTLIIMGGSTFAIGCVPSYETIGFMAPLIILLLRLLQGLALGGEYGGAATYVAEHSPAGQRGFYTSFIQTTATLGLFVSLGVILSVKLSLDDASFNDWGWRIPFLVSIILVAISYYIRLKMKESPLFAKLKTEGKVSTNPLKESFAKKGNLKMVLLALFGAVAGQGVVWYTGQFYALSFIQKVLGVQFEQSNYITAIALVIGTPFFLVFGALSDKWGRKGIMMAGMFIAAVSYMPIYKTMAQYGSIKYKEEIKEQTSIQTSTKLAPNNTDSIRVATTKKAYTDGSTLVSVTTQTLLADATKPMPKAEVKNTVILGTSPFVILVILVLLQVLFVTMVYGPIAAFLVELFPTRIRYTSMSLPYHIGNGVFGGLTPYIATRLVESSKTLENPSGDIYSGLWYPIIIAGICFVIGMIYLPNKNDENVMD